MFGKREKCSSKTVSHEDFNVDLIADSDSENSNTNDSYYNHSDQTAMAVFMNELVKELNWRKCFSKKVSIARSENSPLQWLHSTIICTSNVSNSITTTVWKTTWTGTKFLFSFWLQWGLWKQTATSDTEHLLRSYVLQYIYRMLLPSRFWK